MKKMLFASIAAVLALTLSACSGLSPVPDPSEISSESSLSSASPAADFEKAVLGEVSVINKTGYEIIGLFLSPSQTNAWEENLLGSLTMPDNSSFEVNFPAGENARYWDLQAVTKDEKSLVWYKLDLSKIKSVSLLWDGSQATAEIAELPSRPNNLVVTNGIGSEIIELYISPVSTNSWENNLLTEFTLPNGGSCGVNFETDDTARFWDIQFVDASGKIAFINNLDLYRISEIELVIEGGEYTAVVG